MICGRSVAFYSFLHQQTDSHVITDILLKVALNTSPPHPTPIFFTLATRFLELVKKNPNLRPDVLAKNQQITNVTEKLEYM